MARFETNAIAGDMRVIASYLDKHGLEYRAKVLRRWAEELDPPAIRCTADGCNHDASFRVELSEHDDEPSMVSFRCGEHVAVWMMMYAPSGSIKVDLL